jgi:hypothetical protein
MVVVRVGQNALAGWWAEILFFLGDSPGKGQFRRLAGLYEKKARRQHVIGCFSNRRRTDWRKLFRATDADWRKRGARLY